MPQVVEVQANPELYIRTVYYAVSVYVSLCKTVADVTSGLLLMLMQRHCDAVLPIVSI